MSAWYFILAIMMVILFMSCSHKVRVVILALVYLGFVPFMMMYRNQLQQVNTDNAVRIRAFFRLIAALNGIHPIMIPIADAIPEDDFEFRERDVPPLPSVTLTQEHLRDDNQCPICLDIMTPGSQGIVLNCNHVFHEECLNRWRRNSNTCPVCRAPAHPIATRPADQEVVVENHS